MRVLRWRMLSDARFLAATAVLTLAVCCSVPRVQSLPCNRVDGAGVQLAKVVCFVTASSEHYDYESLRTGMCSHVILIDLMGVGKDGSLELLQASSRSLNRFNRMRRRFRDVGDQARFIVSIGGVAQKSSHFSKALQTPESRHALADELISFNIKHGLDGIDIAWFYPAQFGGAESDRTNLVVFLRDLSLRTKACDISLSLTVGVDPKDIELSYDVPRINEVVDFVNLLTGDYHNPTVPTHISPLYGQGPRDRLNINYSVNAYIEAGLNPRKIVILNSCYAYLYVSKINKNDTACPVKLRTVMRLSFLSAREIIIRESFQTSWDDMRNVPYGTVTNGITKKWITFNDVESVRRKADYVLHYQLGGMGLFSVDEDDYGGRAGCGRYPMLRTIVAVLYPDLACDGLDEQDEQEDIETIVCPHNGYLADPVLPEYYYVCEQGLELQACPKQRCPQGEVFDEVQNGCCQQTYPVPTSTAASYIYDPVSQYPTIAPPQYFSPVACTQPQPPAVISVPEPMPYPPLPSPQCTSLVAAQMSNPPAHQTYAPLQQQVNLVAASPMQIQQQQGHLSSSLVDLYVSPSTMAPSICEPIQEPSNLISEVVISPNALLNSEDYTESASTMAPVFSEQPTPPALNDIPKETIAPSSQSDLVESTEATSTMSATISELKQEPSNVVSQVVISPNAKPAVEENAQSPSTLEEPEIGELIQQPSANVVSKVLITPNAAIGEPVSTDQLYVLVTPKPKQSGATETTNPMVMITPKQRYNRPSRRSSSRRRSRTRSNSTRAVTEANGAVSETTPVASSTEATPSASSTSSDASTISVTSTRDRSRARSSATTTTILTNATSTTETAATTTKISATTTTEPPPATTGPSTTTVRMLPTTTTPLAATKKSTTTALPLTTGTAVNSTVVVADGSSTSSANVTFSDETTTVPPTTSVPSTWVTTTTATTTVGERSDTASHLVTTVT